MRNGDFTPWIVRLGAATLTVLLAQTAAAQHNDAPPPPLLDRTIENAGAAGAAQPPAAAPPRPPTAAELAPLPEDRVEAPEEIIVVGSGWRLPDLGSSWRAKQAQKEAEDTGRFHATFLPLYDPNNPPSHPDSLFLSPEWQRVGYIELFRLRFGHRNRD